MTNEDSTAPNFEAREQRAMKLAKHRGYRLSRCDTDVDDFPYKLESGRMTLEGIEEVLQEMGPPAGESLEILGEGIRAIRDAAGAINDHLVSLGDIEGGNVAGIARLINRDAQRLEIELDDIVKAVSPGGAS